MKKRKKSSLVNPNLIAIVILMNTSYPHPRYAWDWNTVMPSDLVCRTKMKGMLPLEDGDFDLSDFLDECKELRR